MSIPASQHPQIQKPMDKAKDSSLFFRSRCPGI